MLKMRWRCDVCHGENVCDVSSETHFFGVVLVVTSDHKSISPSCEWTKIRGWPLSTPATSYTSSSDSGHRQRLAPVDTDFAVRARRETLGGGLFLRAPVANVQSSSGVCSDLGPHRSHRAVRNQ
jgi:hypothetical protein